MPIRLTAEANFLSDMQGSVDQVDGLLCFETDTEGLQQWDEQIGLVCNRLNTILESAAAKGLGMPIEV